MDLPLFTVGRQYPCLNIWKDHCRARNEPNESEVDKMSGLPKSLLDLISKIGDDVTERDFWDWPGQEGAILLVQLWEAYRLATILFLRQRKLCSVLGISEDSDKMRQMPSPPLSAHVEASWTKDAVLLGRVLGHIDYVHRTCTAAQALEDLSPGSQRDNGRMMDAVIYPAFAAGVELARTALSEDDDTDRWKDVVRSCIRLRKTSNGPDGNTSGRPDYRDMLVDLLEECWSGKLDRHVDIDALLAERKIELALL